MPKELTHWLLADQSAAGLGENSRLRKVIEAHRATYLGGAVLPDTLLHLFRSPHAVEALALAHTFHDTADNSFAPLILAESSFPDGVPPALLACLLGVITHIVTDIVFHPYVYALTGAAGIGRHYQIETGIDVHFLQTGVKPAVRHVSGLINPDTRDTLVSTSALLFDPTGTLPRPVLEQALSLHCRLQSMYDKAFWKLAVRLLAIAKGSPFREQRHLFYPLSRSHTVGGIATNPQRWRHPVSGELHTSTLEELASKAVQRIISLFTLIEAGGSLAVALTNSPGENLLTGLHGVCRNAMDSGRST
jgi:hypothetical protein